jgi:CubicO group peptidase (beta-lactamase class C family)
MNPPFGLRLSQLLLCGLSLLGGAAPEAEPAVVPSVVAAPAAARLTAPDVEAWLDGFMPVALARGGFAGAVVVVVKDGAVLCEKGYGYADIEQRMPVDPRKTLFRPGSVSKLFTWTAVMQLVEAGKLDLDADVNRYLDFQIPPREGKPITLRHLMTHTPGFEETIRGLITASPSGRSLGEELKRWVPTRVFEAGTTPAYSNYGAALAGYIVERVSHEPFEAYVEAHIFAPLGMHDSTFVEPLPARLLPQMSKGYEIRSKPPGKFEFVSVPPAGSLSATGDDMAKFMIAHLENGRFGEAKILEPATARQMHETLTRLMAPLNGIALGFYQQDINGHRVIAHGGDTNYFHSSLELFPDDHVGLYLSLNSAGSQVGWTRLALFEQFADRYFPSSVTDPVVDDATARAHARVVAGHYIGARGSFSNWLAVAGLVAQAEITANADGTVSMSELKDPDGSPRRYREIGPFLWRQVGGHDRLGAIVRDGKAVRMSTDLMSGVMVFDRAPATRSAGWIAPATIASALILLATAIAWPVGALVRRHYRQPFPFEGLRRRALRAARLGALVLVLALAGWATLAAYLSSDRGLEVMASRDWIVAVLEVLTLAGTVGGTAAAAVNVVATWRGPSGWFGRLGSMLLLGASAMIFWLAYAGNLMNFSLQY